MMKTLLILLVFLQSWKSFAVESPCYWQGQLVKCLPTTGIYLNNSRTLRLGTNNETNYVELLADAGMAVNYSITLPGGLGTIGQVLYDTNGTGVLGWTDPGVSQANVNATVALVGSKRVADLVCHANVALTGVVSCDGQPSSNAAVVLLMAQTDPTENGLWLNDDFGAWTRVAAFTFANLPGSLSTVTEQGGGTAYQNTLWLGVGDGSSTGNYYQVPTTAANTTLAGSVPVITTAAGRLTTEAALSAARGGTGVANNAAATLTRSGNHALTFTTTNTTSLTLPTSGTVTALGSDISLTSEVSGVLPIANGGSNKALTLSNGGIVWTDADSFEVVTASSTASDWILSGAAGSPTFSNTTTTAKTIDGSADAVQLTVQGHSTQTSDIFLVEKSDGTDLLQVTNVNGTAIRGTTTNDAAATGFVGQELTQTRARASATGLTTGTALSINASALQLTAGDWDVTATCGIIPAASTTITQNNCSISKTTNTTPTPIVTPSGNEVRIVNTYPAAYVPAGDVVLIVPTMRVTLSTQTDFFLVEELAFGASTATTYGYIRARRVR